MSKSFAYRLFGFGRIPAALMTQFAAEGVVALDEGVSATVTLRNFRRPGKVTSWQRRWITASLVLTKRRFVALYGRRPMIDVPLDDPRLRRMQLVVKEDALHVDLDASLFHADWSGEIAYRFRSDQAQRFHGLLAADLAATVEGPTQFPTVTPPQ